MEIKPKEGVILVRKHISTSLMADIAVNEDEQDNKLITGEVLEGDNKGKTAIFGKYTVLDLNLKGTIYSFVDVADIIGFCNYTEKEIKK